MLVSNHLTAGIHKPEYEYFVRISALHPDYDRAKKAVEKIASPELLYVNEELHLTPGEIQNIRARAGGANSVTLPRSSFNEAIDGVFAEMASDKHKIPGELCAHLESPAAQEGAFFHGEAKQPLKQLEYKPLPVPPKTAEAITEAAAIGPRFMKVGTFVVGGIFVADQIRRGWNKDSPSPEEPDLSADKKSGVLNYLLAAAAFAGVTLVILADPKRLGKITDPIAKLFGAGVQRT